ncbi:MAG: TetR family transcriptional regulator [Clostridia bacterium]|nr:TetR family transcriptional regulator [Clostridia bacterium]
MKKSEDTKKRILVAAEEEFAQKGFYGARVDEIAECAEVNKRMLYAYFGNKEELYKTVLLNVYNSLSLAEDSLIENDKNTDAATAVQNVIGLYFDFLKNNDNFVRMLMWENLNNANCLKSAKTQNIKKNMIDYIEKKICEGKIEGIFSQNASAQRVTTALLTFVFSYFSNKHTLSLVLDKNLASQEELNTHREFVCDLIINYLKN